MICLGHITRSEFNINKYLAHFALSKYELQNRDNLYFVVIDLQFFAHAFQSSKSHAKLPKMLGAGHFLVIFLVVDLERWYALHTFAKM